MPTEHSSLIDRSDDGIIFATQVDAELGFTDRTRRNYISKGILPQPDGNLLGRVFWKMSTYRKFKADLLGGKFSRERTLPHLRNSTEPTA